MTIHIVILQLTPTKWKARYEEGEGAMYPLRNGNFYELGSQEDDWLGKCRVVVSIYFH